MSESFIQLSLGEQKEILNSAVIQLGKQAQVLEKDYWVCWTLDALFSMPEVHPMAFKGGTSLSKVFDIIERFSEDVDITLDYRKFSGGFDPFGAGVSKSAIKKFNLRLKDKVKEYTHSTVMPYLKTELAHHLGGDNGKLELSDDGENLRVFYPSLLEGGGDYIKSSILIEFGGRNVIKPSQSHKITPYLSAVTTGLNFPVADVIVLSPHRTFWEKATLIHVACNKGKISQDLSRQSRHWYDLVMLSQNMHSKAAISDRALLADVVRHKKTFFHSSYANYDACLDGNLRLIPDNALLDELRSDYQAMQDAGMFFEKPLSFSELIEILSRLNDEINAVG